MGIGIPDVHAAWKWYRNAFGINVPVFEEAAEANLMLPYTGGQPHQRHAILAINPQGGGGMEIWQYTSRTPQPPAFDIHLGDLGFLVCKIKCRDVLLTHAELKNKGLHPEPIVAMPDGRSHFFIADPYGNQFELIESDSWFQNTGNVCGGVYGCTIGVSNMERSMQFYADILGYDQVLGDTEGVQPDLDGLPGGKRSLRRVTLTHSEPRRGSFSRLTGQSEIELLQITSGEAARPVFQDRFWGDLGFIHLCFDIKDMAGMREKCRKHGHPFTVDSAVAHQDGFDMGEAAGNFSYIEDPDGALIEFVETLKVPIMKKVGWYLDLRKRAPEKPLPNWMLKAMALNRVRD